MAHYLRAHNGSKRIIPSGADLPNEIGRRRHTDGVFVTAVPLVMHDACAKREIGPELHPWSEGRRSFSDLAGQPLCWSAIYSDDPDAPPCYWCGNPVQGRG